MSKLVTDIMNLAKKEKQLVFDPWVGCKSGVVIADRVYCLDKSSTKVEAWPFEFREAMSISEREDLGSQLMELANESEHSKLRRKLESSIWLDGLREVPLLQLPADEEFDEASYPKISSS